MTHTIACLNQKGGSGKTTLSINITRGLQLKGYTVLLVDSDPQGSTRDWSASHEDQPVPVVGLDRASLDKDISKIKNNYDFVVIDGAPAISTLSAAAIKASDTILIPVQPSPLDLWATADLLDLIEQRKIISDQLNAYFVMNRVTKGTRLSSETKGAIHDSGIEVLDATIHQRISYAESLKNGTTAFESKNNAAEVEMGFLVDEILAKINQKELEHAN